MSKSEAATPAPPPITLCAICIRSGHEVPAVTTINGTSLCKDDAIVAPRSALPYAELG